jgi:hypothetical protein
MLARATAAPVPHGVERCVNWRRHTLPFHIYLAGQNKERLTVPLCLARLTMVC